MLSDCGIYHKLVLPELRSGITCLLHLAIHSVNTLAKLLSQLVRPNSNLPTICIGKCDDSVGKRLRFDASTLSVKDLELRALLYLFDCHFCS